MTKIAILGGGSWGTALAIVLSRSHRPHDVSLWVRNAGLAGKIAKSRENASYLAGCTVPEQVAVNHDLAITLKDSDIVIGAMPSAHARSIYSQVLPLCDPTTILVSATKGLEPSTHLRMSEVVAQVAAAQNCAAAPFAVLSGPSFALETARGDPTVVVISADYGALPPNPPSQLSSSDKNSPASTAPSAKSLADYLQAELAGPSLRLYTNDDILGVELAGAMKNVIAIAAGTCQGLGLGTNVIAALITRGLAEMARLALALGARAETLNGLAGLGDLVLTCTGALSRNRQLGIELGKGRPLQEILASTNTVAEGVGTTSALLALAAEHHIELPITEQVEAVLHHHKSPLQAMIHTMERPQKPE
jgi:glycerol-3-phosphate dehydrogenase (NAD(P)+)